LEIEPTIESWEKAAMDPSSFLGFQAFPRRRERGCRGGSADRCLLCGPWGLSRRSGRSFHRPILLPDSRSHYHQRFTESSRKSDERDEHIASRFGARARGFPLARGSRLCHEVIAIVRRKTPFQIQDVGYAQWSMWLSPSGVSFLENLGSAWPAGAKLTLLLLPNRSYATIVYSFPSRLAATWEAPDGANWKSASSGHGGTRRADSRLS